MNDKRPRRLQFLSQEAMTDVTGGLLGEAETKVRRMLECAIPTLPAHVCRVLRQRAVSLRRALGKALKRLVLSFLLRVPQMQVGNVCNNLHTRSKTIILDSLRRRNSIFSRQTEIGLCMAVATPHMCRPSLAIGFLSVPLPRNPLLFALRLVASHSPFRHFS
jgi:hypothetical protein